MKHLPAILAIAFLAMFVENAYSQQQKTLHYLTVKANPTTVRLQVFLDNLENPLSPVAPYTIQAPIENGRHILIFQSIEFGTIEILNINASGDVDLQLKGAEYGDECHRPLELRVVGSTSQVSIGPKPLDLPLPPSTLTSEWRSRYPRTEEYLKRCEALRVELTDQVEDLIFRDARLFTQRRMIESSFEKMLSLDTRGVDPSLVHATENYVLAVKTAFLLSWESFDQIVFDEFASNLAEEAFGVGIESLIQRSVSPLSLLLIAPKAAVVTVFTRDRSLDEKVWLSYVWVVYAERLYRTAHFRAQMNWGMTFKRDAYRPYVVPANVSGLHFAAPRRKAAGWCP
ncbi:MAG: hypothetical protein PWP23_2267 [Candidatus Sumerlaeota bacterium]|nr:hypothetical protein [Candidatus Sumerlaeota bacterium]